MRTTSSFLLGCALVAGCGPAPRNSPANQAEHSLAPEQPFPYKGLVFRFPPASVDVLSLAPPYPYARLFPQGSTERFDYFVELGRPQTARPRRGQGGWIGGQWLGPNAVMTPLADGYQLWCEPLEGERGSCAVLLREAPLAALLFPIVSPPTDDQAVEAVRVSEDYLIRAKQPKL